MTTTRATNSNGQARPGGSATVGIAETRRATIQDVARVAGVSVSAVSKVVRGAYGVSPQMHTRVNAAIAQLGYRPHAAARAMRGRSFTIGVVLSELASPFQPEVASGVGSELKHGPYQGVIVEGGITSAQQKRGIEALLDRQVDGLVLVAPWVEVSWLNGVAERIPVVTVALHGQAERFDTVVDDERLGAQMMVDHLMGLGHRAIVHTTMAPAEIGESFALSHTARQLGFEETMRRHDLVPDVIETSYSEKGGYDAGMEALSRAQRPTAIFAGADIAALGVLRAVEELGLRVPEDVSVAGYDNIYVSTINRVSLTTIDQSGNLTGAVAARLLLERIAGRRNPVNYVISPRLIARATTGPAPRRQQPGKRV